MDFIITTTDHMEGYDIDKYYGVVSVLESQDDDMLEDNFDKCFNNVKDLLIKKAKKVGANAVVGVKIDLIPGEYGPQFLLTGTAVKISNNNELPEL